MRDDFAAQIIAVRRTLTGGITDAARCREIGSLYRHLGLSVQSQTAFRRSESLCQDVLRRKPNDGFVLAEQGRTLAASGHAADAETELRKAAKLAPRSADVQMALASTLALRAEPGAKADKQPLVQEAAAAYDRAILLAPRDPRVWTARGNFHLITLPTLQGKPPSRDGLSDFVQAAALSPNDAYAQAQVPDTECLVFETAHNFYTSLNAAKAEPRDSNLRAKEALRRLTKIGQSTQGRKSAGAYDARAWVQFEYFYDPIGTQKSLRLALLQNPGDEGAKDYQMHVAAVTGDFALMAAVCRRELRRRPTLRLHILLAYADYFMARQKPEYWQEGVSQMEIAHAAAPSEFAVSLGFVVFLLASGRAAEVSRAGLLLRKMSPPSVGPRPPSVGPWYNPQDAEYSIVRSIGAALAGHPDDARQFLGFVLQNDPKNTAAKAALSLLPPPAR